MRLINTEEFDVISWTATGRAEYDEGYDDGVSMMADRIDSALTIDAIPVEWLRNVLEEAKEFPRSEHETIVAIPYLIKRWQKEQEAQDG